MNWTKTLFIIVWISCFPIGISAQSINVDDTKDANELASTLTGTNSCITPSNAIVKGNNSINESYGTFNKNGGNFPFDSGVILSTRASKKSQDNAINDTPWNRSDADLEKALNLAPNSTRNTTSLEFEFEAKTSLLSFNYLFASDEYRKNITYDPCNRPELSDGLAILIKEIDDPTSKYDNLAIIETENNSTTFVSSFNIRPDFFVSGTKKCDKKNIIYFDLDQFNSNIPSSINFAGQTKVLKALKNNLIPGKKYKIKFVIAEGISPAEFSALFIEAGSFASKLDLGKNRLAATKNAVCNGETITVSTGITGVHKWSKTDSGTTTQLTETSNVLAINQPGTYKVEVINSGCTFTGEIKIEYAAGMNLKDVELAKCDDNGTGTAVFDLTAVQKVVTNNDSENSISGYYTDADLMFEITDPKAFEKTNLGNQVVYVKGINPKFTCFETAMITLKTLPSSQKSAREPNPIIKEFAGGKNSIELISSGTASNLEFSIDGINYQENSLFTDVPKGKYFAYIRNTTNCEFISFPFTILDYPTFFTPNGDGINDEWKISDMDKFPKSLVYIFDRYGKLLKQMNASSVGWNGTLNGLPLPADDYWFRLILNDNQIVNGHFSLKR